MSDSAFLDTNILIYAYSDTEHEKQNIARQIITQNTTFISTQVLQELCNVLTRKFRLSYSTAVLAIQQCSWNSNVYVNTEATIVKACNIAQRYGFSFFDSLIISAAMESDCTVLYSEDMQDGQIIEGKITIKNPFK